MKKLLPIAFLTVACCASAHAQIITENPDSSDAVIVTGNEGTPSAPAVTDAGDYEARVGEYYSPGGSEYVMPFVLPTLAAGEVITDASLQTQLYALIGTPANADLYAIGTLATPLVTSTPSISPSFYYQGTSDPSNTLIQANFLTPASTVRTDGTTGPFTSTTLAGNSALAAYLNAAEGVNGANAGQYVYLRLTYDATTIPAGNNGYELLTDNAGGTFEKPILSITEGVSSNPVAAPEPSTYALMIGGLAALFFQMRRRTRSNS